MDEQIRRIVMSQPIPDRLMKALADAPLIPAHDINWAWRHVGRTGHLVKERVTPRQADCLAQLAAGRRPAEAARELGISVDAVKQRLEGARARLGARNSLHAVAIAIREGVIE